MNKPITMIIKETKEKLANVCNESGLSLAILDLIVQGIYSEVHALAEKQFVEEEMLYTRAVNVEAEKVEKKEALEKELTSNGSGDTDETY